MNRETNFRSQTWQFDSKEIGRKLSLGNVEFYLGNRHLAVEQLSSVLGDSSPVFVKQVHGNQVCDIETAGGFGWAQSEGRPEADGMVTHTPLLALTIATADCLPILIAADDGHVIGACHAGWRGLVNGVIAKTVQAMELNTRHRENLKIVIGPHIQPESFEVGNEVASQLIKTTPLGENVLLAHTDPNKKYVDLTLIAITQLQVLGVQRQNIWFDDRNTFLRPDLSSYRRDGPSSGRNFSSIVIR